MSQRNLSNIARAEAVAQLGSSEQLDQRLIVIRPSSWILLLISALLVALSVAWGFLGRLPNLVEGQGVMVPRGREPIEVFSPSGAGGVIELMVPEYSEVKAGDPIIRLDNRDLEVQVDIAKSRVETLESQDSKLREAEDRILDRQKSWLDAQLASANQTVDQTQKLAELFEGELQDLKELVEAQLVPRSEFVQTQQAYFGLLQQISEQQSVIAQANERHYSLLTSTEQARLARAGGIAQAHEQLRAAQVSVEVATQVLAPIDGTLLEHRLDLGSTLAVGSAVASIQPAGGANEELVAVAFVPYGTGRRIREGMDVRLSLPFARPSRFGYILGEVVEVSRFVVDLKASAKLGSRVLAADLAQKFGPMLEVVVRLDRDTSSPTGLRWTSGRGYPRPLDFPTLCAVEVVVSEDRPIDLVIPWVKDLLGIDPPASVFEANPG